MADTSYLDSFAKYGLMIDAALGADGAPPRPELWASMTSPEEIGDPEQAARLLNAGTHCARALRIRIAGERAAIEEAKKQQSIAKAQLDKDEKRLAELEENLVLPIVRRHGNKAEKSDAVVMDTGFARVAIVGNAAKVVLSERGAKLGWADAVALLPHDLVRVLDPEPDKEAIRKAIEDGRVLKNFELKRESRVQWR